MEADLATFIEQNILPKSAVALRYACTAARMSTVAQYEQFINRLETLYLDGVMTTIDQIDDGGAVNLSTGIFTSFIDFAKLAAGIAGYHPQVKGLSDKPAGVHARGGDTTKQKQLGFQYKIGFRTGIERALQYYSQGR